MPAGRVHTMESLTEDEHLADVGFFRKIDHPSEGTEDRAEQPQQVLRGASQRADHRAVSRRPKRRNPCRIGLRRSRDRRHGRGQDHPRRPPQGVVMSRVAIGCYGLAAALLFGSAQAQQRADRPRTSMTAGFVMRPADTPGKMKQLQKLKPHSFTARTKDGVRYYIYADPTDCKCAFVGYSAGVRQLSPYARAAALRRRACSEFSSDATRPRLQSREFHGRRNERRRRPDGRRRHFPSEILKRRPANKNPASRRGFRVLASRVGYGH